MAPKCPFPKEECVQIVGWWYELKNLDAVRWKYAKLKGIEKHPRKLPKKKVFKTVIDRFQKTGSVNIQYGKRGKTVTGNEENIEKVRSLVTRNPQMSIRQMSVQLDLPYTIVWKILRDSLNFFPYKIHLTTELTEQHKRIRLEYSTWLLTKSETFPDRVIWSDEKIFLLHTCPNRQNERVWAPRGQDPNIEEACRVQGGPKIMCWGMMLDGRVYLKWFDIGVRENTEVYIRDVLEGFMWPILQSLPNRGQYWFQQDGARAHTSKLSLEWIREKFGTRVISGNTAIPWPAHSPDKSPLDYFLWGNVEAEIRRVKPEDLEQLKEVVNDFVDALDEDEVIRACRDVRPRAELCIKMDGSQFESQLKKYKQGTIEE